MPDSNPGPLKRYQLATASANILSAHAPRLPERMLVCESEENRRKLAWLVPGYILLAWFFCVVFQPLGLTTVPGRGNNNDFNDESLYEILNLQDDPQVSCN